jgi:hypothetical protein
MPRLLTSFSKRMEDLVNLTSSALNVETQGTCPGFVLQVVVVGGEAGVEAVVEAVVEMGASNVESQVTFLENVQRVEVDLVVEVVEGVDEEEVEADFSDNISAKFAHFFFIAVSGKHLLHLPYPRKELVMD